MTFVRNYHDRIWRLILPWFFICFTCGLHVHCMWWNIYNFPPFGSPFAIAMWSHGCMFMCSVCDETYLIRICMTFARNYHMWSHGFSCALHVTRYLLIVYTCIHVPWATAWNKVVVYVWIHVENVGPKTTFFAHIIHIFSSNYNAGFSSRVTTWLLRVNVCVIHVEVVVHFFAFYWNTHVSHMYSTHYFHTENMWFYRKRLYFYSCGGSVHLYTQIRG